MLHSCWPLVIDHCAEQFIQVLITEIWLLHRLSNISIWLLELLWTFCSNVADEATRFTENRSLLCLVTTFSFWLLNLIRYRLSSRSWHLLIDCFKFFGLFFFNLRNFIEFISHMLTELLLCEKTIQRQIFVDRRGNLYISTVHKVFHNFSCLSFSLWFLFNSASLLLFNFCIILAQFLGRRRFCLPLLNVLPGTLRSFIQEPFVFILDGLGWLCFFTHHFLFSFCLVNLMSKASFLKFDFRKHFCELWQTIHNVAIFFYSFISLRFSYACEIFRFLWAIVLPFHRWGLRIDRNTLCHLDRNLLQNTRLLYTARSSGLIMLRILCLLARKSYSLFFFLGRLFGMQILLK